MSKKNKKKKKGIAFFSRAKSATPEPMVAEEVTAVGDSGVTVVPAGAFDYSKANEGQREAIEATDGPVLIIAGPGTGKTYTLVQRALNLIVNKGVKPEEIMMATFTEKAAKELVTRISNELTSLNIPVNLTEMYIGTFHSICLRIIKENLEYTRIKKNFRTILVKSISRFARNTVDALNYIRELKELGISIYFENENIDTLTPGGEVLITILAAMAEQESRTMSTNIKWTYQKKFKNGEVILNTGLMLGYTKAGRKDEEGREIYEINEAEATIVRRIYREYLAGTTITRICRGLEEDGIPTKLGKKRWQYSVVNSILTNEKYTGDAVLGKTFKPDVLSKYRQKNNGQAPMYYAEGTHPAIIDKDRH